MTKNELRDLENKNIELYGDSIYVIYYQTKNSVGRYVIRYAYYMTDERFKKKIEKSLAAKDIIAVSREIIPASLYIDVYADRGLPIRVSPSSIEWEQL